MVKILFHTHRLTMFIFVSFFLHFLVTVGLHFPNSRENEKGNDKQNFEIVEMTPEQMAKIRKQVVETEKTKKSEKAADNAFLGEQTQIVDRQTKAENGTSFLKGQKAAAASRKTAKLKDVKLADLGVAMNLKPQGHLSPDQRAAQAAQTSDHLTEIKQGAQTLLNTKEFAYFSFYQRVRKQLEQFWEPGLREKLKKMFDRGRNLASEREHSTRLFVMMDATGTIRKIKVGHTSGVLDLDQAAIDAFNKAGPFPNPPRGMVDQEGYVTVEWEFVLRT